MASVTSANPFGLLEQEDVVAQDDVLTKDERPKTGGAQPLNKKGKKPPADLQREQNKKPGNHNKGKKHGDLGDRQSGTGYGPNKNSKRSGGGAYNVGGQSEVQAEAEEALARERGQRRRRRAEAEAEEEQPQTNEPEEPGVDLATFKKQQRDLAVTMDKQLKVRDASQSKEEGQFKKVTEYEYKSEFKSDEVLFVLKDDIEHKKERKGRTQRSKARQVVQIEPLSYEAQEAQRSRGRGRGGPRGGRGGNRPFRERRERTEPQQQEQQQDQQDQPAAQEPDVTVTADEAQAPAKVPAEETTPTPEAADDGFKAAPQRGSRRGRGAGGERGGERGRGGRGRGRGGRGRGGGERGRGGSERGGSRGGGAPRGDRGAPRGGDRGAPRGGERGARRGGRGGPRGGSRGGRPTNFAADQESFPPLG